MKKTLLIVEDNLILCDILERWLQKAGYRVLTAIDEPSARRKIKGNNVALVLTDVRLPEGDGISLLEWSISQGLHIPFVVMTEHASIADAVRAVKLGAKDYLPKPVHEELLMELLRGLIGLPVSVPPKKSLMKRLSGAVRETERIACRVAPLNCSVMILGPNGSGKESVAQLIQQHSGRKDKPFVAVNCGCIRGELAASEFFGHVQGAFTDAKKDTAGYFETAKGGTLFLDEIGNMPPEMQTLLLRVLQERVYCPVGSRKELEADVRILSATNEDMERAIREGRFREDLYYRLAEFEIRQPSLSECPEDILPLADFFREQHSEEIRVETSGFTEQAKISMLSHSWPGNVRELDNRIRRAVLLAVSSYGSGTSTSGVVKIIKDLDTNVVEGADLLIVEDILDSGKTLSYLKDILLRRNPASFKICTLLDKPERRLVDLKADYSGAVIPDAFVVGYGLDYDEKYRNLPYVGILKPKVYEK